MKHLTTFRLIDAIARSGSIRAAGELMSQTPSAVQRRLQSYETELGEQIFERTSTGVRLNAAGELAILHIREILAETDRLQSRLADLSGLRRGHVSIVCSQALTPYFLPRQIALYQRDFPAVTFDVRVLEHADAARALNSYTADLSLVFDEERLADYRVLLAIPQPLVVIMAVDHPLAASPRLRLRQCLAYPVVLPMRYFGGRTILERALLGRSIQANTVLESTSFEYLKAHVAGTDALTFQVQIGAPTPEGDSQILSRAIDPRDLPMGMVLLGQRHDRTLPVATSRFVQQISRALSETYGPDSG